MLQATLEQTAVRPNSIENGAKTNGLALQTLSFQFSRQGQWTYEHWLQFRNDGWKNESYDRKTKYALYEQNGVSEYWLVNYWEKSITVYELVDGTYKLRGNYKNNRTATSTALAGFRVRVDDLFSFLP